MVLSVNCLLLQEASKNNFNAVVGEVYTNDDKINVNFSEFTVSNFKELLFRRKKVKHVVQDSDSMELYKVELDLKSLKDKIFTEDEIKNLGTMMEPEFEFKEYFNNNDKKPKSRRLHIFIVPTSSAGQKRCEYPESIDTKPKKRLRSVINLRDLKELIAEIKENVAIVPPPELYPKSAKDIAGRFSKEGSRIPITGKKFPDMRLDDKFISPMGDRLIKLCKDENMFHLLYAVSGKTRAIFDMAMHNEIFITYIECLKRKDEIAGLEPAADANFGELVVRITEIFEKKPINLAVLEANRLIALEFTARVLHFILLKENIENLTPRDYLLAQINGGQNCIANIKLYLISFEFTTAEMEAIFIIATQDHLTLNRETHLFAIDEANAATTIFFGNFLNHNNHPRGLLTPLITFLGQLRVPIVIAGTSFTLGHGKSIYGDIGKGVTADYLVDFKMLKLEEVESYLERYLDLSECNLKNIEEIKYLAGRPRFAARFVLEIIRLEKNYNRTISKQDVLKQAIKQTIEAISDRLKSTLENIIKDAYDGSDKNGWKNIMEVLFVNCWFFGGYVSRHEVVDRSRRLIDSGIARLVENDKKSMVIDELITVDVVKTVLLPKFIRPDESLLQKLTAELKRNATKISDTSKGATWQYLAQAGLMRFNEKSVADFVHTIYDYEIFEIGGIKKTNLPEWANKAIINIKSYGDLDKLSWQFQDKINDDVDFISLLLESPKDRKYMLEPSAVMRPDGVYIGNNISDSGDDYWTLLISAKIYGIPLSGKGVDIDKRTTDWRYVYYDNSEDGNTHQIKKHIIRGRLDTICDKYKHQGSLRIHFILPDLAENTYKSDRGGCRIEPRTQCHYVLNCGWKFDLKLKGQLSQLLVKGFIYSNIIYVVGIYFDSENEGARWPYSGQNPSALSLIETVDIATFYQNHYLGKYVLNNILSC
ncbi:11402_t:CDS:2 [Funneliformis mosseae]|uniref:11402_t:CDS:1 n=1 Tax=Funneliformis mosseae TaxID=27381 RepID=A0A9N8W4J6_FUNMO|nr:11402_t:CDS:2 [Funneliformis mosseae]